MSTPHLTANDDLLNSVQQLYLLDKTTDVLLYPDLPIGNWLHKEELGPCEEISAVAFIPSHDMYGNRTVNTHKCSQCGVTFRVSMQLRPDISGLYFFNSCL